MIMENKDFKIAVKKLFLDFIINSYDTDENFNIFRNKIEKLKHYYDICYSINITRENYNIDIENGKIIRKILTEKTKKFPIKYDVEEIELDKIINA